METYFDIWVKEMANEYKGSNRYKFCANLDLTFCYDKRTGRVGTARRHPDDQVNPTIGKAIAYARCVGHKIPAQTVIKNLKDMRNGERFYPYPNNNRTVATYIGRFVDGGQVYHAVLIRHRIKRLIDNNYEAII